MFKKSKPKVEPPPTAPTLDEMLADIETFEISQPAGNNVSSSAALEHALLTEPENLTLETWWQVFDEYDHKVKKLAAMEGTLDAQREKLLACKLKLEKNAKNLREGIQKQQTLIKEVVDC
ncbi:uncharacterized protein [Drosophila virilis]|uniref:Uncharacterized protein, isoform A n=1 Tax=Drosophila virilis TaxID=7244 RepID=B4M5S5_DROVI|nr:uncharacterized protein LOC6632221 [Drosophila virilis]XP_015025982.1 uncharacterized protein LOC6632221 [Drosophila virilis]EDW59001.1 uncharacterized protein Dvir_GJ10633, isoform A [Drosophila virilis]KRF78639.1 uncharacterized protein Dvir_GJ10633, isoform B [Drosophila virilis]